MSLQMPLLPGHVQIAADALNMQIALSQRLWTYAAFVSCAVLIVEPDIDYIIKVFGFDVKAWTFYPLACVILSAVNIAFASSELRGQRNHRMFKATISNLANKSDSIGSGFNVEDFAYGLKTNSFNSISPLTFGLRGKRQRIGYFFVKLPVDVVYYLLPICAIFYSAFVTYGIWQDTSLLSKIWLFVLFVVVAISTLATLRLLISVYDWLRSGFGLLNS